MLKKQYWMANDNEFQQLRDFPYTLLTEKYRVHPYAGRFKKEWCDAFIVGTYKLESEEVNYFNCLKAMMYLESFLNRPLSVEIIKHTHKLLMDGEPITAGKYRDKTAYAGYHSFLPVSLISGAMDDAVKRYNLDDKKDPVKTAAFLFNALINIHPFEDGNGRLCRLILSHVLIQMKCSLFPVLLSTFHKKSKQHYVQALKKFQWNPSLFYTMVAASLVHGWDEFLLKIKK